MTRLTNEIVTTEILRYLKILYYIHQTLSLACVYRMEGLGTRLRRKQQELGLFAIHHVTCVMCVMYSYVIVCILYTCC